MSRRSDKPSPAARRALVAFQIFLVLATVLAPIPVMAEDPSAPPRDPRRRSRRRPLIRLLIPRRTRRVRRRRSRRLLRRDPPTAAPTDEPTTAPTDPPTSAPTDPPTSAPTAAPTDEPTAAPTDEPTSRRPRSPRRLRRLPPNRQQSRRARRPCRSLRPSIKSDLEDYPPGGLVTLTGSNWQPGESVHIFVNDDFGSSWSRNVDVIADASGNITDQFNLPNWFVATYSVTATGARRARRRPRPSRTRP